MTPTLTPTPSGEVKITLATRSCITSSHHLIPDKTKQLARGLLSAIEGAYVCCHECGLALGSPTGVPGATYHTDNCCICLRLSAVTSVRRYQYLRRGREALKQYI
jgi:hypothetical protein